MARGRKHGVLLPLLPVPETRCCNRCDTILPISAFRKGRERRDGTSYYRYHCIDCERKESREYEQTRRNPDRNRRSNLKRFFKLTPEEWDDLFDRQGRRCRICSGSEHKSKGWHTDHDHKCCPGKYTCGKCIRAILCGPCNSMLGHSYEKVTTLKNAIAYIEHFAISSSEVSQYVN